MIGFKNSFNTTDIIKIVEFLIFFMENLLMVKSSLNLTQLTGATAGKTW